MFLEILGTKVVIAPLRGSIQMDGWTRALLLSAVIKLVITERSVIPSRAALVRSTLMFKVG